MPVQHYYKQPRFKQLRAFCKTVQLENMSKAAEALFLSQPTISLQIQSLERDLGAQFFERHGPVIKLTPEGQVLYQVAQPLVEGIESLKETFVAQLGRIESGELSIAAGESTSLYILPKFMKQFAEQYPGIRLRLMNVTGMDGMKMLRADEVDLAIGPMLELPEDVVYKPSISFTPTLITPLDHPLAKKSDITLQDISPYGLILPPRHLTTWRGVDNVFRQHNVDYTVSLEAGGYEIIKKYVESGLGISIVTDVCLKGDEKLARKPLDKYFPLRNYGVVVRKGRFLTPQAKLFIEMVDPEFFHYYAECVDSVGNK
ncbi:MAG: LysR family transcriptional regulator [Gammaproteobacteria bacterium]|nr:MAG: LysR family transcriptional regulator [Gammaproteobacteria bacterium]